MKLPQPLFDVPSTQRKAKAKKKRKKSRAKAVDSVLSSEISEQSRDDDGVDVEGAERPATEDEPFDARWEFDVPALTGPGLQLVYAASWFMGNSSLGTIISGAGGR